MIVNISSITLNVCICKTYLSIIQYKNSISKCEIRRSYKYLLTMLIALFMENDRTYDKSLIFVSDEMGHV